MKTKTQIDEMFVNDALSKLAALEKSGYGIAANGRSKKGAPVRVTPSEILTSVQQDLADQGLRLRNVSIRDVEQVLRANGFDYSYEGNKHFFSIGGGS